MGANGIPSPPATRPARPRPQVPGGPHRGSRSRLWLLAAIALIAVSVGALMRLPRRPHPATTTTRSAAPLAPLDPPSPEELVLVRGLDAASPADPTPARRLGDFYTRSSRPFEGLWAYSQALHAQPTDLPATLGIARALEAGLLLDRAVVRLGDVLARAPGQEEAVERLTELYLRTGQPAAALAVVRGAGNALQRSARSAVREGRIREALGDARGAREAYRRAVDREKSDPVGWDRLGLLALAQGQLLEARQALERAHGLDPTESRYTVDLGRAYAAGPSAADRQAAIRLFQEAVQSRPYAPAFYQAGLLLTAQHRLPQATAAFGRATTADRSFGDAFRELAGALETAGRRTEAHYQRGLYYSVKDLRPRSLQEYLAMAAADPQHPGGLLMASQSRFKMQQNAMALALARQAFRRFPTAPEVREQLAALLILTSDRKAAAQLCQAWLREEPGAAQPIWMLGQIAAADLRFDEAIHDYEQALAKQPDNATFLESLGEVLLEAPGPEHLPRAVETLSRAVALAPEDAKARYQLGLALTRAGRLEEARRQMLRSLDLDPNRGPIYSTLVSLARRLRQPGPAALFGPIVRDVEDRLREELALWRHTWDQPNDAAGYVALAHFLLRTGDPRRAESQLEQALVLRPHEPAAEAELARVRRLLAVDEQTGPS
jgi:tetratricopeptide (TPR) repeat protein